MGYITNTMIAKVKEDKLAEFSLAANGNFVEIDKYLIEKEPFTPKTLETTGYGIEIENAETEPYDAILVNNTAIVIQERSTNVKHYIKGKPTKEFSDFLDSIGIIENNIYDGYQLFSIPEDNNVVENTNNLMNCLAEIPFFKTNYNLSVIGERRNIIDFRAKGTGNEYGFSILEFDEKAYIVRDKNNHINREEDSIESLSLTIKSIDVDEKHSVIKFVDTFTNTSHSLEGTTTESKVNNQTFFIAKDKDISVTVENIRACMMNNSFLKNNFDISIQALYKDSEIIDRTTIKLTPKGSKLSNTLKSFEVDSLFINKSVVVSQSTSIDSILEDKNTCEIQLDIYKDTEVFPGMQDYEKMGSYITTLSKTYFGQPVWFDVNTIWVNQNKYSNEFLDKAKAGLWVNTGTDTNFRFVAKRFNGVNHETFYYSDVLHTLTGYCRNLEENDLSAYVYNISEDNGFTPLTKQLTTTHIRGQKQYFNFILADPEHKLSNSGSKIGLFYKVYTQSGSYLGKKHASEMDKDAFQPVNTICLDIDSLLDEYPKAGIVKVFLCRDKVEKSEPMIFHILPDCLYKVNDFAFLNSLGGWSSFNFGGMAQTDFKSEKTTIHRTQTPDYTISSQIESVFYKDVTEQFVVQTMPIKAEVAEWLKELSASVAVYELKTGRYVVVDELNVKHNTKDDLFTLQMKYHYSDSYNK